MTERTLLADSLDREIDPPVAAFYRQVLQVLGEAQIPFLVGGAFAHACHTGIRRPTKDLDLFIRREDFDRIEPLMQQRGWRCEMTYPHWLAKVYDGAEFIDLIFNSGNGLTPVDARWFKDNDSIEVLGVPVQLVNVEDALLTKAFIMERERFDGGDIAHLLQTNAERLDWASLLQRFGAHWRVLLAHLVLFGYIYQDERGRVPGWVMDRLVRHLADDAPQPVQDETHVCAGTLLSREQYLHDVEQLGYVDGRLTRASTMTAEDVTVWTEAIGPRKAPDEPPAVQAGPA
jgi:predicted nucleotidyltransferase